MALFHFPRPKLAHELADAMLGESVFSSRAGLFLAAPRRTGKSHFLRNDLVPELEKRGVLAVYTDLWSDKSKDPALVLAEAIKIALRDQDNVAVKSVRKMGVAKLGGDYLSLDVEAIGQPNGTSISDALLHLIRKSRKPVALLVDEAQHAVTTTDGFNAMFALKAARDAANQTTEKLLADDAKVSRPLSFVFTGSHRDKLAHLVLKRNQPFYGGTITDFPLLGEEYVKAYTDHINAKLSPDNRFESKDVLVAFQYVGYKPEVLEDVLSKVAFSNAGAPGLAKLLHDEAKEMRRLLWEEYEEEFSALTPLQQAIITRLGVDEREFSPFSASSLAFYGEKVGEPVSAASAQTALDGLREKAHVWRSARGNYAIEDQGFAEWIRHSLSTAAAP